MNRGAENILVELFYLLEKKEEKDRWWLPRPQVSGYGNGRKFHSLKSKMFQAFNNTLLVFYEKVPSSGKVSFVIIFQLCKLVLHHIQFVFWKQDELGLAWCSEVFLVCSYLLMLFYHHCTSLLLMLV